jgi:hypothetical protein
MGGITCLLFLVGVGLIGATPADRCHELTELNTKHRALERQYEVEWEKRRQPQEDLWQAIRSLNAQQRRIIFSLLREAEARQQPIEGDCCRERSQDLILRWVCVMATYLRGRDPIRLVQTMPADPNGIASLWKVDPILGDVPPEEPSEVPEALRNRSFVDYLIDRTYELVLKNHDLALSRFLSLLVQADGHYGEDLEERFARLVIEHPQVILARWPTIRRVEKRIRVGTTDFASHLDDVLRKYRSACKTLRKSSKDCQEVLRFLKRLAT